MRILLFTFSIALMTCILSCAHNNDQATPWIGSSVLPKKDSAVLLACANDATRTQADRASAVLTFFAHYVHPGSSAVDIHQVFTDTAWLRDTRLYAFRDLLGMIPVQMTDEDTVFCIHLFPVSPEKDWSPWVIYFRLSGKLRDEEAFEFLRGQSSKESTRLIEFALCFPHSSDPTNFPGHTERFSRGGIRVYQF